MQIKNAEYQGKDLQYIHHLGGRVRFNTNDFFNILGVNPADYVERGEREFIDYEVALPIAFRIDSEFESGSGSSFRIMKSEPLPTANKRYFNS